MNKKITLKKKEILSIEEQIRQMQQCEEANQAQGKELTVSIETFFEFAVSNILCYRTHCLHLGDYLVSPCFNRERMLTLQPIVELDSPERGDFVTSHGTIGPLNANIFIGNDIFIRDDGLSFVRFRLIEGDRINSGKRDSVESPVYNMVNAYVIERQAAQRAGCW